jgi:hypothetical protein
MIVLLLVMAGFGGSSETDAVSRCDRGAPQPIGFHARGFGYVAEVFPPRSRQNTGSRPVAYFYAVGYPGTEWRVDARRVWTAELVNAQLPEAALVSMAGDFVTLDDYHEAGRAHALVIYARDGRLIRSFALEQLLDSADLAHVPLSDCGWLWREGTAFYFTRDPDAKLYVAFRWGRVLELTLATGELRRGGLADFAALRDITGRPFPNEHAESWSLNLRFSSITDMNPAR